MNLFFLLSCTLQQETKLGIYNQSPNASILAPTDDSTYDEGQVVEFSAVVDDDFTDPTNLIISWQSDLQGELPGAAPSQDGNILQVQTLKTDKSDPVVQTESVSTDRGVSSDRSSLLYQMENVSQVTTF